MAINFTDSPSNGATQTISGRTYTYNSAKNKWDTTATEVTGPTATTYATVDDLPGTATAGDQAFVSGTNRLYIWNGSGWYNIALINNTPTWTTQPASSYALEIDGTATVVSIVASDPEGLPITYSITSDTSGNVATVVQGTGLNTNSWTITPSTSNADAGTFSLTFRASDGINIASAISSFTLQFKVVNQKYTTALITSVGANNAVNNSFDDKSTSNHTITANGDAHQTTFSPYRHGGYSTFFDGTTDYLKVTDSAEHDFGTGEFSMEFWWWPETVTGNSGNIHIMVSAPNNGHNQFIYHESNYWYFQSGGGGATVIPSSTGAATAKTWNHVVLCRSGTTMSIFSNGTRTATVQSSAAVDFSHATIGRYDSGGYEVDGYVRDMRWLKGSSAYDATQTSITLPTEPLTAVTNTTLLTCHLPYIADGSTTGHSIAVNGNTKTEPFAPYDAQEYSATDHLGSMYLDGTGDYLSISSLSGNFIAEGSWTQEMWIRLAGTGAGQQIGPAFGGGFGGWNSSNGHQWLLYTHSSGFLVQYYGTNNSHNTITIASSVPFTANTWHHWAVSWDGTTLRFFVDGTSVHTTTTFTPNTMTGTHTELGRMPDNSYYSDGHLTDVRIVAGTAVYTSNFTPPTAPLTAITNTSLLLQGTDAGIIDKAQSAKSVKLLGNTKSSTTQTKFLSSSMAFDGTSDYIAFTSDLYGWAGDFAVEAWVYHTSFSQYSNAIYTTGANGSLGADFFELGANSSGRYQVFWGAGTPLILAPVSDAVPLNTWSHIALTRSGSTLRLYLNGSESASTTKSGALPSSTTDRSFIGTQAYSAGAATRSFYGYMSDVRLTKGLARYTANFTPPTAALQG